jgi:hypothetical protein
MIEEIEFETRLTLKCYFGFSACRILQYVSHLNASDCETGAQYIIYLLMDNEIGSYSAISSKKFF